jgi:hypothetical protein
LGDVGAGDRQNNAVVARLAAVHRGDQPYGLAFGEAVPATDLSEGQIVVLDGHVIEVASDPGDPELVRLTLVRALGPPPGRNPDQRRIELVCPRNMVFATAVPHNIDLAPLTTRP